MQRTWSVERRPRRGSPCRGAWRGVHCGALWRRTGDKARWWGSRARAVRQGWGTISERQQRKTNTENRLQTLQMLLKVVSLLMRKYCTVWKPLRLSTWFQLTSEVSGMYKHSKDYNLCNIKYLSPPYVWPHSWTHLGWLDSGDGMEVCSVNWLPRPCNTPTQHDISVLIHQGGLQRQLAPQTLEHTNTTWHQCTHTSGRSAASTGSPDPATHQHNMTSMYSYIREVCSVNWLPTPWNTPTQHDINVPIHQGGLQRQLAPQTLQHTNTTWHQCTHTSGRSAASPGSPDPGTHQHNMTSMYPYIKEVCSVNWLPRPWNTPTQHDINVPIHQGGLQHQLAPQTLQHTNTTWHQCTHTSGRSAVSTGSPDPGTHQHNMTSMYPYIREVCSVNWLPTPWNTPTQHDINVPIHQGSLQCQLAPQTLQHTNTTWHQCTHTSGRSAVSTGSPDPATHQHNMTSMYSYIREVCSVTWLPRPCNTPTQHDINVPIHQGGLQRQLAP